MNAASAGPDVRFDSADIRRALRHAVGGEGHTYTGVATDSRAIRPGDLFVALLGERHDGADFLPDAAARGARGAIVPEGHEGPDSGLELFEVADPLVALGHLATDRRVRSGARVIAVTGSSGKTTVKEMIACALAPVRAVHRTSGNLNSRVGLPLSILDAPADADVWVLELGASEPGEIAALTAIANPDDAVVTTVGPAHLEAFVDESTVLREKLDLVRGADLAGSVVVGERPDFLPREARRIRPDTAVAGLGADADVRPDRFGMEAERVWFDRAGARFEVPVGGEHNLRDALIAAGVAEALDVPPADAARGLAAYRPVGMRGALERFGDLTVVADCYNANPESFTAAIDYCRTAFPGRRLTAFVGTMLELGDASGPAHGDIVRRLVEADFEVVAATGEFVPASVALAGRSNGTRFLTAEDAAEAWEPFAEALRGDEIVLVKGSRGVRLERVIEWLAVRFGETRVGGED